MRDSYYDRELDRLYEQRDLAKLGMRFAAKKVEFKENNQERARKAIVAIVEKIIESQDERDRDRKRALLSKKVKGQPQNNYYSSYELEKELINFARKYRITWTDGQEDTYSYGHKNDKIEKIAERVAQNPADALISFSHEYSIALTEIERTKKDRLEEAQRKREEEQREKEEERKRQIEEQRRLEEQRRIYTYEETPSYSTPTSSYSSPTYHSQYTEPRRRESGTVSEEFIQDEVTRKLRNKDQFLGYDLRRQIEAKYHQLDDTTYYGDFYGSDNIEDIYQFFVMSNPLNENHSNNMKLGAIIELGTKAVDIVFKDLMNGHKNNTTHMAKFMSQFEPHKTLERYEAAREKYMNFYRRLNEREKNQLDGYAAKFDVYRELFNLYGSTAGDIATVEDIKRVVNKRVREEYIQNDIIGDNLRYNGYNAEFNINFESDFRYSVKYMSIEEIASLYKQYMYQRDQYFFVSSSLTEEERNRAYNVKAERDKAIQYLFANTIRQRLTNSQMQIDPTNEAEKEARREKREMDLVAICRDYFHEEPKFDVKEGLAERVPEGYGEKRVETAKTIEAASRRYYGMSKFERVFAGLDFRHLKELSQKDTLSVDEMERVKRMF